LSAVPERREARRTSGGRTTGVAMPAGVGARGGWLAEVIWCKLRGLLGAGKGGGEKGPPKTGEKGGWHRGAGGRGRGGRLKRRGKAAGRILRNKGEATADLMLEVAQFFFRLRALGQRTGLITSWGGGAFGFIRSLALIGPLTVPQIAQMRPTSRQRMQRLADE